VVALNFPAQQNRELFWRISEPVTRNREVPRPNWESRKAGCRHAVYWRRWGHTATSADRAEAVIRRSLQQVSADPKLSYGARPTMANCVCGDTFWFCMCI
jgi:hypothetical protein